MSNWVRGRGVFFVGEIGQHRLGLHLPQGELVDGVGQGSQSGDFVGEPVGGVVQLIGRHHLVDEPDAQGLVGVEKAAGEQDVEGVALAHKIDKAAHLAVSDGDAEAGHRDAEAAALGGDAEVGGDGHLAASASSEALDHGDGGRRHFGEGFEQPIDGVVVAPALHRVGAVLVEVGDVCPGGECFAARASDDHAADVGVGVELAHQGGKLMPHIEADCVALPWPVEGDGSQRRLAVEEDVIVQVWCSFGGVCCLGLSNRGIGVVSCRQRQVATPRQLFSFHSGERLSTQFDFEQESPSAYPALIW